MIKNINKKDYYVNSDEFITKEFKNLENLKIIPELNNLETEIGFITDLIETLNKNNYNTNLFYTNPTHGGFIPLNINFKYYSNNSNNNLKKLIKKNNNKNLNIYNFFENNYNNHKENLLSNLNKYFNELKSFYLCDYKSVITINIENINILKINNIDLKKFNNYINLSNFKIFLFDQNIFKSKDLEKYININNFKKYVLKKLNLIILLHIDLVNIFESEFKFYFINQTNKQTNNETITTIDYDNLIQLVMIVKNSGKIFKKVLEENKNLIDRWCILDTGSTDGTQDVIREVLKDKKGELYEEPFIDFGTTRNRSLELSGNKCKFKIILDDTYVYRKKLRRFLEFIRGDQISDSFSIIIQSKDSEYCSNRIIKTESNLKYIYKIHEVIQNENNFNVFIPQTEAFIYDYQDEYMNKRTINRKQLDLKLLFEMVKENPDNPRHLYYLANTYSCLENYDKVEEYFLKRIYHPNEGFLQEKVDACFELARLYNFILPNIPWRFSEKYYKMAFKLCPERPEPLYFIGINYLNNNEPDKAFKYFKSAFNIPPPFHLQYSLKPTLYFYYLPISMIELCYKFEEYQLGLNVCNRFLINIKSIIHQIKEHINNINNNINIIESYFNIFKHLTFYQKIKEQIELNNSNNSDNLEKIENLEIMNKTEIGVNLLNETNELKDKNKKIIFIADGNFYPWSGSDILTKGMGGSETHVIEMSRYIKKYNPQNEVIVFCNCSHLNNKNEIFEGVKYIHLELLYSYLVHNHVDYCIISRFSEYIPLSIKANVDNIYVFVHDLNLSGIVVPINPKIKKIFCLTKWHQNYFNEFWQTFKKNNIVSYFHYGIDFNNFSLNQDQVKESSLNQDHVKESSLNKQKNKFIYSSYPNRGLVVLLEMWPKIYDKYPDAELHIFSDINNEWSNKNYPEQMKQIKLLLNNLIENKNKNEYGIKYHGWVDKKTLAEHWKTSQYWFYPCIFKETFCLTALEAALTKTLAITNGLAALEDTVGDRGITILGDPLTNEWKELALKVILKTMSDNPEIKERNRILINKNYKWASKMSWKNRAELFYKNYLI